MSEPITLDTEAAQQAVQAWRDYGDQVKAHGQQHHMNLDELRTTVGDAYSPYVDAKQAELQARQAAYARVAANAHGHAQRLSNTATIFTTTDEDSAARMHAILADGTESVGTQGVRAVSSSTVSDEEARLNVENMQRIATSDLPGAGMQF